MYDDIEILFNINNLITNSIKRRIEQEKISGQVKMLFDLIDFEYSETFTEEKNEISDFYMSRTQVRYEAPYLDNDTKEFILNYALTVNDIEKTKKLINSCCYEPYREEAIDTASETINKIKTERNTKIYDNINLELANSNMKCTEGAAQKNKKTQSLSSLLSAAKEKAKNNQ